MRNLFLRRWTATVSCVVAIVICVVLSLTFGARSVSVNEIIEGLFASKDLSVGGTVVHERLPRTVFGLIAGASLGMSGSLMQAITRNPLADPGILGVNSGASLAVVCGIAFLHISNLYQYIALALIGAGLSAIFVYLVGSLGRGGATPIKLALAGAATSATLISLVSAIMLPRAANMDAFRFWQVGGIGGATWSGIATVSPLLIIGAIIAIVSCGSLNALALGDDVAAGLGVNTSRTRLIGAVAGILLCGAVTALAGPIGFVGLMIPHAIRALTGPDLRWNIPLSAGGGAVLLTAADIFGRLIGRPGEIDCGLITAFIGAPVLVYIAMKTKVKSL